MASSDIPRSNPSAVLAVRAVLGCTEEVAIDVVEAARPHLERPLLAALAQLHAQAQEDAQALGAQPTGSGT